MRHRKQGRKLGRNSSHRKALGRNLVSSLFEHGRITTTVEKAKEYRPMAEKMITLAKKRELHNIRRAVAILQNKTIVKKLFEEIAPRYLDRPGGYTRIVRLQKNRLGDNASQAIFELVGYELPQASDEEEGADDKK